MESLLSLVAVNESHARRFESSFSSSMAKIIVDSSNFLKLNPIGFVPVLVDADSVILDSFAIIMYLEDKYPDPPLLPPHDIHKRAINFQAVNIVSSSIQPFQNYTVVLDKYKNYDFGRCPRVYCSGQPCVPVGQSDIPRSSTVKIYCPRCEDIYYPWSKYQGNIDGAYFGTTFPHLFLMTYGQLKPQKPSQNYVPRVFGFKLHKP